MNVIANEIFIDRVQDSTFVSIRKNQKKNTNYRPPVDLEYFIENDNPQLVEQRAKQILEKVFANRIEIPNNSKRYKFTKETNREKLLNIYFNRCFAISPDAVIEAAQYAETNPKNKEYYPNRKKDFCITIPEGISNIIGDIFFKITVSGITALLVAQKFYSYHESASILASRIVLFTINNSPFQFIKLVMKVSAAIDWFTPYRQALFVFALSLYTVHFCYQVYYDRDFPIPVISRFIENSKIWKIAFSIVKTPQTVGQFIFRFSLVPAIVSWRICNTVSSFFHRIALSYETERLKICKPKAFAVWTRIIRQHQIPQAASVIA